MQSFADIARQSSPIFGYPFSQLQTFSKHCLISRMPGPNIRACPGKQSHTLVSLLKTTPSLASQLVGPGTNCESGTANATLVESQTSRKNSVNAICLAVMVSLAILKVYKPFFNNVPRCHFTQTYLRISPLTHFFQKKTKTILALLSQDA